MKRWVSGMLACLAAGLAPAQPPQSFVELQTAARTGNADAQFRLGEAYRTGTGTTVDRDQAIAWFKRASDAGNQPARDALGMLLFTRGNRQEAIPLIEAAAARGDARALYILATARFNGDYVARDWARAYAEMSRAAELGLPQARTSLTQMEPYLLPADRAKAEQIRASMAATAPSLPTTPLPRATTIEPPRIAASPAPVPPVRAMGDGMSYDVAASTPARSQPSLAVAPPPAPLPRTRSVPQPPIASVVPAARPASVSAGTWRAQLGAYGSRERAEAQWSTLVSRHAALGTLGHVVTPAGALFRLQAEGLAGRDAANALCRELTASGTGCFPVAP